MPAARRRVRRLHLRAEADADAARAAALLTDALHTASLPSDRGRLVVIRRLALGRISTCVSPAALALHIEQVARDVLSEAIRYDLPGAAPANAVLFPDHGEAIVALAGRHARRETTDQWFWPAAVPGWRDCVTPDDRWIALLEAAHALPEGVVTAAAVVDQAIRAAADDRLLTSLRSGQATRWLSAGGFDKAGSQSVSLPPVTLNAYHTLAVDRSLGLWSASDDRSIWLGTMCAVAEHPARAADARLPSRIAAMLRDRFEQMQDVESLPAPKFRRKRPPVPPTAAAPDVRGDTPMTPALLAGASPVPAGEAGAELVRESSAAAAPAEERGPMLDGRGDEAHAGPYAGVFTPYAGLLFVIPVLDRLSFGKFLAARPALLEADFPLTLLWRIARSAGLTPADPLGQMFERAAVTDPEAHSDVEWLLHAWRIAVRGWCRRRLRVPLATVICRPGRVHVSRTHMESSFDLSQLDLRLRRLALDVDPGWVPWFGRVVRFHYGDLHDGDR